MSPTPVRCESCGSRLPAGTAEGLCPLCVPDDPAAEAPEGRVLGDCELFEEIGRGGMGVVWRGRQRGLDRPVAVKTLPGGDLAGAEARARFRTEALATARLKHPNIVSVYDVGEADGMPYFVMELIEGRTLGVTLAEKPVPPRQAALWLRDAALAVHHAHEQGVLHRDLKPSNILIEPGDGGGRPRVTDFGLAKFIDGGGGMTLTGTATGSPSFMPPEQARGGEALPSGDVYGLGAVLYHALTGRPPFQGETVATILTQVERDEPIAPRRLHAGVPLDLETICLRCLEKDPARRYPTARELADDLSRFLDGQPVVARPLNSVVKAARLARRHPWPSAAAGLVAALIASAFSFMAWRAKTERQHQGALRTEQTATKLALMTSRLGEARAIVRLNQPDSRPRALAIAQTVASSAVPLAIRDDARNVAVAALALPEAHTSPLRGDGVVSDDWTLATGDLARDRWALAQFRGPVVVRPLTGEENDLSFEVAPRVVTALMGFSPGGRWLAMRHRDELGIWDTTPGAASPLAFVARPWVDGIRFGFMKAAFAVDDGAVLWADRGAVVATALPGGKELARWQAADGSPLEAGAVAFDPTGQWFAIARSADPVVEVRAWPSGEVRQVVAGLPRPANTLALTAGAVRVATGDASGHISVALLAGGGSEWTDFSGHTEDIRALRFAPDGRILYSTSDDGSTRGWDVVTGLPVLRLPFDAGVIDVSPDGRQLAAGYAQGRLSTARVLPSECFYRIRPSAVPAMFQQVSFVRDSRSLITMTANGVVRCAVPGGEELAAYDFPDPYSVAAAPDADGVLWVSGPSGLQRIAPAPVIAEAKNGKSPAVVRHTLFGHSEWGWTSLWVTPDGRWLASSDNSGTRAVVLPAHETTAENARILFADGPGTGALALAPDGLRAAVGFRYSNDVMVFDVASQTIIRKLVLPPRHTLDWSPDGRWLAASGSSTRLWDTATWEPMTLPDFPANHPPSGAVAFAPVDAARVCPLLAIVSDDTRIMLIDAPERRLLATLESPDPRSLHQLQFSADGRWLAAATSGGEVHVWDLPTLRTRLETLGLAW